MESKRDDSVRCALICMHAQLALVLAAEGIHGLVTKFDELSEHLQCHFIQSGDVDPGHMHSGHFITRLCHSMHSYQRNHAAGCDICA